MNVYNIAWNFIQLFVVLFNTFVYKLLFIFVF